MKEQEIIIDDAPIRMHTACAVLNSIIMSLDISMEVDNRLRIALTLLDPQKDDDITDAYIQARKCFDESAEEMEEMIKDLEDTERS